jgi:hypothetical protein
MSVGDLTGYKIWEAKVNPPFLHTRPYSGKVGKLIDSANKCCEYVLLDRRHNPLHHLRNLKQETAAFAELCCVPVSRQITSRMVIFHFISVFSCCRQLRNIALNKATYQSSTAYGASASRAVDGVYNPDFAGDSCTHTNDNLATNRPWWYVDLGRGYPICAVTLTNRDVAGKYNT